MRIDVLSIFPAYLDALQLSLTGKAQSAGLLEITAHDLREFTHDKHRSVDDTPYGGGAGMVMKPEPWGEALDALATDEAVIIVPTPSGVPFTQRTAERLSNETHLVFACGRYEGIDQRVRDQLVTREISIGDYVLTGGELAAAVIIDAITRLLPGAIDAASLEEESHTSGLLEYPHYTRPADFRGWGVPDVLLSGHHAEIARWRAQRARELTRQRRPDLLRDEPEDSPVLD